MSATPLIRSILLVLLAGTLTAGAPIRAAAPRQQTPRTPITPANVAQIIDLGAVVDTNMPIWQVNWLADDALVIRSSDPYNETPAAILSGPAAYPLANLYPVTLRSDDLLTVSPDRTQIAVLNIDPYEDDLFELHIYTPGDNELLPQNADVYAAFKGTPGALAYSPDGVQIAVVSYYEDMSIIFRLNAQTGALLGRDEISTPPYPIAFTPDSTQIVVGGYGSLMLLAIDVVQLREVWGLEAFPTYIQIYEMAVLGDMIITLHSDGTLAAWRLADGTQLWQIKESGLYFSDMTLTPAGDVLAVRRTSGVIEFYAPATGVLLATIPGAEGTAFSLAFSPDGSLLAATNASWDEITREVSGGSLHLWGMPEGTASGDGPASGDSSDDGPPDTGGALSGPAPTPAGLPTDGTYPLDPPGESS